MVNWLAFLNVRFENYDLRFKACRQIAGFRFKSKISNLNSLPDTNLTSKFSILNFLLFICGVFRGGSGVCDLRMTI
jgi:hypothetical protein